MTQTIFARNNSIGALPKLDMAWRNPEDVAVVIDRELGVKYAVPRDNLSKLAETHPHLEAE